MCAGGALFMGNPRAQMPGWIFPLVGGVYLLLALLYIVPAIYLTRCTSAIRAFDLQGDPGSAVHLAKGGQRVSTMVIYLNDVEEAGETTFPDVGLSVTPKKGAAVYFEYCNSQNQVDPLTLHAGAPVAAGEKWIATKWMRQRRYG